MLELFRPVLSEEAYKRCEEASCEVEMCSRIAHECVCLIGPLKVGEDSKPGTYIEALERAWNSEDQRAKSVEALKVLKRFLGGDDRMYTGLEVIGPEEVWHHDVPGDGSCLLSSIMASFYISKHGEWPSLETLKNAALNLRKQILESVRLLGDTLLLRKTAIGGGMTLRARIVSEYARPSHLAVALYMLENDEICKETMEWNHVIDSHRKGKYPEAYRLLEERDDSGKGRVDLDGDFLPVSLVHSMLSFHVQKYSDWCGTVELDLIAHASHLRPWDRTEFRVYQYDRFNQVLRQAHYCTGQNYGEEEDQERVLTIPIFSNGQNHIMFAGEDGNATHFSCLAYEKNAQSLPAQDPFRFCDLALRRCPATQDNVELLTKAIAKGSLSDMFMAQRKGVCMKELDGFASACTFCDDHLSEFGGSLHGAPEDRLSVLTPDTMRKVIETLPEDQEENLGLNFYEEQACDYELEQNVLAMIDGSVDQHNALSSIFHEINLHAGSHKHLVFVLPSRKGIIRKMSSRLIVLMGMVPCRCNWKTITLADPMRTKGMRTLVDHLNKERQSSEYDLPYINVVSDEKLIRGDSSAVVESGNKLQGSMLLHVTDLTKCEDVDCWMPLQTWMASKKFFWCSEYTIEMNGETWEMDLRCDSSHDHFYNDCFY